MLPTHAAVLLGQKNGPSLDLNFVNGSPLDSRIQFTRASSATYFDATGTLQSAGNNVPRIDYGPNPTGRTNWVKNSTMQGAMVGTPGSLPNIWAFGNRTASLTTDVVGTGTENGFSYIDLHIHGTTSDTVYGIACSTAVDNTPAVPGQIWTGSAYFKLVSGSLSNITSCNINIQEYDSFGTTWFGDHLAAFTPSGTLARTFVTAAVGNVSAQKVRLDFELIFANGVAIDITLRIAAPQLERDWIATPWIPTSGSIVTVGAEPLGLLIEEQRTNLVPNPRCEGAVAGTPGTAPTGWAFATQAGVSYQVIGTGVEDGIPYVDVRFYGTPTVSGSSTRINVASGLKWAAASTDQWTVSYFMTRVGGSSSGISNVGFEIAEFDSSNAFIGNTNPSQTIGTGPLRANRLSATLSNAAANVAQVAIDINNSVTSGVPIDITYRIGLPQFEKGSFATYPILPPAGSPSAASRATETATLTPITSWFNAKGGTLYVEAVHEGLSGNAFIATINDGTQQNEYRLFTNGGNGGFNAAIQVGGVASYNQTLSAGTITPGDLVKSALSYGPNGAELGFNGSGIGRAALAAGLPSVDRLEIGNRIPGVFIADAWIKRIRYWPRAIYDAQIQQVTDPQSNDETLDLNFILGNPIDSRIQFSRASGGTYFDRTGTLQTAASNQPRIDYDPATLAVRGLLIEEQRTNSTINPRAEGASPGTPGTMPTGWTINTASLPAGLASSVIGIQTKNGVPGVAIRISGTATAAGNVFINSNGTTVTPAQAAQVWSISAFLSLISGDMTNVTAFFLVSNFNNGGNIPLNVASLLNSTPTRYAASGTAPSGTTGIGGVFLNIVIQPGVVDFTVWFGLPQLELGAFPTSPILPPSGSPAASTRAIEAVYITPLGPWFNPASCTVCVEATQPYQTNEPVSFVSFYNSGSPGQKDAIILNANSLSVAAYDTTGPINSSVGTETIGVPFKAAYAFSPGVGSSGVLNGGTIIHPANKPSVSGIDSMGVGCNGVANQQINGYVRRARYWPRVLSDAELQKVTS